MDCKKLLKEYFTNFSMKLAYDIVFSCKACILLSYIFYTLVMYMYFVPEVLHVAGISNILFSIVLGALATVMTVPVYFIGLPFFLVCIFIAGMFVRLVKNACSGGCLLVVRRLTK